MANRLQEATRPGTRAHVVFDWSLTGRDASFSGTGVMRLDTGYRARVDLFGPRGETYAAAIIEDDAMRMVPQQASALLPPPALLWSLLGAFRVPTDAPLAGTQSDGSSTTLEYARDRTRWSFRFEGAALRSTEWTDGNSRRTVTLTGASQLGFPAATTFRDWTEFRELTLRVTHVEEKTAFEPDVWILPGER
ncbi:MAG TPA: hypothetical protein VK928_05725 [Longimicrobiales bacterium]|nr:hypothetical protein [Longimicrobiales bacterium]